jgi:hypothetical protein
MSLTPPKTLEPVDVEGVGRFVFRKRRVPDQVKIQVEYQEAKGEAQMLPEWMWDALNAWCALKVLTVQAPPGWDLDEIDPSDGEQTGRLVAVWEALREAEKRFRAGAGKDGVAPRA